MVALKVAVQEQVTGTVVEEGSNEPLTGVSVILRNFPKKMKNNIKGGLPVVDGSP